MRWVVGLFAVGVVLGACSPAESEAELTAGTTSTVVERSTSTVDRSTTTERQTTTTVVYEDLARLESLTVGPEVQASTYARALFPHWDDRDRDGCDTRCEVLTSQRHADGGWFSEWDGATEYDSSLVHVDHVAALAEAWRSRAHTWPADQLDEFADDRANLLAVTASANMCKRDRDTAGWFPSRYEANCLWARTVVVVKSTWQLSVDPAEKDALANLLTSCGAVPPTAAPPASAPAPAPAAAVPFTGPAPSGDCTPGYDPCLPPAEDYDCAGGSGNEPAYTDRVSVDHAAGDPHGLDSDGVGCD